MPGWQALNEEIRKYGASVVTVALNMHTALAKPRNHLANPDHLSLVDRLHITNSLFEFFNILIAAWFDERGVRVRSADGASI